MTFSGSALEDILFPFLTIFPGFLLVGAATISFFQEKKKPLSFPVAMGVWFLAGAGVATFLQFLFLLLGVPLHISLLILSIASAWIVYKKRASVRTFALEKKKSVWSPLIYIFVLALLLLYFARSFSTVMRNWDSRAFWVPKMYVLWTDQRVSPSSFIDFNHPEYPLLLPISGANAFTVMREPNESAVKVTLFGFTIALALLIAGFMQSTLSPSKALFFTLLGLTLFVFQEHVAGEYVGTADILVGTYIFAGTVMLMMKRPALAALLWGIVPWVKSEGLVWMGVSVLLLLFAYKKQWKNILFGGVIFGTTWFVYNKLAGIESSQYFKFDELYQRPWGEYVVYSIHAFREEFRNVQKWNLLFFLFLSTSLVRIRGIFSDNVLKVVYCALAVQLLSYILIFTITPEEQATFIASSVSRLTLHLAFAILAVTAYLMGKGKDEAKK